MPAVELSHRARRALAYAWASPATLVGAVAALIACRCGASARPVDGVLEVHGRPVARLVARLPRALRFDAITLGHVVLAVDAGALRACGAHEREHVRQYERLGPLFFPLYLAASALALARGRDPYRHNRFEREAYARAPISPRG